MENNEETVPPKVKAENEEVQAEKKKNGIDEKDETIKEDESREVNISDVVNSGN
jgi:hypothetical protein